MNHNFKKILLTVAILVMVSFLPWNAFSQIGGGGTEGTENPDVPIDGGISLLVAAGVGYGIKKVNDARKKKGVSSEL